MYTAAADFRPAKNPLQLCLMTVGFVGIQFAWGLQMANMGPIYETLGADRNLAILFLAGPVSGLIVQPVVGRLSDRTWGRFGRRKPYFVGGTFLAALSLLIMPNSSALWMAALTLWMLDLTINMSMEPYRAMAADVLTPKQRMLGFSYQVFMVNFGTAFGLSMPWLLHNVLGITNEGAIPATIHAAFYIGAGAMIVTVLISALTTKEFAPAEGVEAFRARMKQTSGAGAQLKGMFHDMTHMPAAVRKLALVQVFTWFGWFTVSIYFTVTVASHVFGATDPGSPQYVHGVQWGGLMLSIYALVALATSLVFITLLKRRNPKWIHMTAMAIGGLSLMSIVLIVNQWLLIVPMIGLGIMFASFSSMPYAILANLIPRDKIGQYFGIFNIFIVLPMVFLALTGGFIVGDLFGGNRLWAIFMGGCSCLIASALMLRIPTSAALPAEGQTSEFRPQSAGRER